MPNATVLWLEELLKSQGFASTLIGTLVGGGLTMAGQRLSMRETRSLRADDRRAAQAALCSALWIKLIKIASSIRQTVRMFQSRLEREPDGLKTQHPWRMCIPVGNIGEPVRFDAPEMGVLIQLSESDVFNKCAALDELHYSFIALNRLYGERRAILLGQMPASKFDASQGAGSSLLTSSETLKLMPQMFECTQLVEAIIDHGKEVNRILDAADAVANVLNRKLGTKLKSERVS